MPDANSVTSVSNEKHCKKCNRADTDDDMVCCDVCESWIHFQCAGVSESIAQPERSFKCNNCLTDWEGGASKSGVSFNESSVSKSSRVSQRLQLSLQLLEDERKLRKKRAEEEKRIRKLEEEAKLKEIDEEQEYLRQKYELMMQIGEEKDSSSRRSGVSVKSRREQLEKWLKKGAQLDGVGQSKPTTSGQKATLSVPAVSKENPGIVVPLPMHSTSSSLVSLNLGVLYPDPTIPVPSGNVTALAKSYESNVVPIPGSASSHLPTIAAVPLTTVVTAGGSFVTSVAAAPAFTSSIVSTVPMIPKATRSGVPLVCDGFAPVYSCPEMKGMLSSAAGVFRRYRIVRVASLEIHNIIWVLPQSHRCHSCRFRLRFNQYLSFP